MNYGVGDTVVCIDATPVRGGPTGLEVGKTYKVLRMMQLSCCQKWAIDVGLTASLGMQCSCGAIRDDWWSWAWRFIKLDGLKDEERVAEVVPASPVMETT